MSEQLSEIQHRTRRLPRTDDDQPRYFHPNGYVIVRWRRSWSERTGAIRGQTIAGPLVLWEVFEHASSGPGIGRFLMHAHKSREVLQVETFREARLYCDTHPRDGWTRS